MASTAKQGSILLDVLMLSALLIVLFGLLLGNRPLSVPDEGRYVEIAREMNVSNDFVTPRLNGVKYFEKPPLFYWFETFLIKLFGLSEWSVRLGPAFFALLGCLSVYYAGMRLWGRRAGIFAAVALSTSLLYYALSRVIALDMAVTVLLANALLFFLIATREPAGWRRRWFFLGFWVFAALATLTKGLIGVVLPGLILFCWLFLTGEWRMLRVMQVVSGTGIFLLIAAPWHLLVGRANPEFFGFYFIHEHFQRYLSAIHSHDEPFWYFIPVLIAGLLPWSPFLIQAVRHNLPDSWASRNQRKEVIFLLLWAGIIFLFFSGSHSKLIPYVLPVLPPLALLLGKYLADAWEGLPVSGFGAGLLALGVFIGALIALLSLLILRRPGLIPPQMLHYAYIVLAVLIAGILLTPLLTLKSGLKGGIIAVTGTAVAFFFAVGIAAPQLDHRTVKPLALTLKKNLCPGDEVFAYRTYYQDLPVYLERRISVVDWTGEMEFGTTVEDTRSWMITDAEFRKRWRDPDRTSYVITDSRTYHALAQENDMPLYPVVRNEKTVIASNRKVN